MCAGGQHRRQGRSRDTDGRFTETVVLEEVQDVFTAIAGPVVTTTDVADVLGILTEAARLELNDLVARGSSSGEWPDGRSFTLTAALLRWLYNTAIPGVYTVPLSAGRSVTPDGDNNVDGPGPAEEDQEPAFHHCVE